MRKKNQIHSKLNITLVCMATISVIVAIVFIWSNRWKHCSLIGNAYPLSYYYNQDHNIEFSSGEYTEITRNYKEVLLVNKENPLPSDYVPSGMVVPNIPFSAAAGSEKRLMDPEAAEHIEELFRGAKQDGIDLKGVSGYRSYATQAGIYSSNLSRKGLAFASLYSAQPGKSEHQTGLSMDVSTGSLGYELYFSFGDTKEGKWLADNCNKYGFIIRYPKDSTDLTGYAYESWHIRYVGVEVAEYLTEHHMTLEEYPGARSFEKYNKE